MSARLAACGHVAATGPQCATPGCGHPDVLHDLARDNTTRKGCSVSVGPKALRCPCAHYQAQEED